MTPAISPLSFHRLPGPILVPQPQVPWAATMTLNPAILENTRSGHLHMLFRACGPWPQAQSPGKPLPYPIFLGHAVSTDHGRTWQPDFSRPCLAPALATDKEKIRIRNLAGESVHDHANGCIEDPRLFRLEGTSYVAVACRLFPPGPYWEKDDPMQCAPSWAQGNDHPFGRAASENLSVTVLFEVNLDALAARDYEHAFQYVSILSDPERGDNRDVFPFPRKVRIEGAERYLCLHRPMHPENYGAEYRDLPPSIFLAAADRLEDFSTDQTDQRLLARSLFEWEGNRIGASWVPIDLGNEEWLLAYHGKQNNTVGYTQSFMILAPDADGWPTVKHRCSDRLLYASEAWELEGLFATPCLFTCGGIVKDGNLIMSYGAADTVAGITWTDLQALVEHIRRFDHEGHPAG